MEHDNLFSFSDLPQSFDHSRNRTLKRRDFVAAVEDALNGSKQDRNLKIEKLDAIAAQGLDDLSSAKLMRLYTAYMDLHAFDRMIDLYKAADNKDFKDAPMVREELAVAYRKVRRGGNALVDKMFDYKTSVQISQDLIDEGHGYGISYENIGRCSRYIAQQSTGFQAEQYYANSRFALEEGFSRTLESSVGIQAVHANILAGNKDKARELAKVVYLATLRDGAEESNDYFCLSAALQVACISGVGKKEIDHLCERLENIVSQPWELSDVWRDLERIGKEFPSATLNFAQKRLKEVRDHRVIIENLIKARGICGDALTAAHNWDKRSFTEDPKLRAVIEKSYNYRGCGSAFRGANRISGNMAFGGQLPDHAVSRKDLRLFEGLVSMSPNELGIELPPPPSRTIAGVDMDKPLTDIRDPEAFIQVADRFIRQTFSTENFANSGLHMENNAFEKDPKTGESLYDTTVKSVLQAAGKVIGEKDKGIDSRTNISAIFALGLGDCRHHAQVKQIMFDTWQKKQMDASLRAMSLRVQHGGRVEKHDKDIADFYAVFDTELRTADIQVMMPVKMQQKDGKDQLYKPEHTADGKYVVDEKGKNHSLEEHTLCWLIRKNRSHKLVSFGIRDAFYQQLHYPWAKMDVNPDDIRLDKNGSPIIPAGVIPGDKTSTGKPVPVTQYPAVYNSGKRDSFIKDTTGRDINLVGLPMAGFKTSQDFLKMIKDREGMFKIMAQIRAKAAERNKTKNVALLKAKAGGRL